MRNCRLTQFEKSKKSEIRLQKKAPNFFFEGMKAKLAKRGGRILLGDSTGGGRGGRAAADPVPGDRNFDFNFPPFLHYIWSNAFSLPTCAKFDLTPLPETYE
jgi:hypothetical protein